MGDRGGVGALLGSVHGACHRRRSLVSALPRRLVARNHREAYDLWATHFDDPALMANRDEQSTRRKLERVVAGLPFGEGVHALDVGPGDGALFRLIANRVASCSGVDPSANAVGKLRGLFCDVPNVEFTVGTADAIPFPDDTFDVVVVNSVLHILPSLEHLEKSLVELVRVCRPGGTVFVGELPFRSELDQGLLVHQVRKLREFGIRNYLRLVVHVYLRPLLRGEPLLLYPANPETSLHVSAEQLEALCEPLEVSVVYSRHQDLARPSSTRNDYWLRVEIS